MRSLFFSSFTFKAHRHLPWDVPPPKATSAVNARLTLPKELDGSLGEIASAIDPSSALRRPTRATTPMAAGMIAAKQSAAAAAAPQNAPLLYISKPGSAARHPSGSSSISGKNGRRSTSSSSGGGNGVSGANKTFLALPQPAAAAAAAQTIGDPSTKLLVNTAPAGDSTSGGAGGTKGGTKPLMEFGYEQLSPRWFKDGASRTTHGSGGDDGGGSNGGGVGGGSVVDGTGESLLGASSHESVEESLSWSDMPLAHLAQPPSSSSSTAYGGGFVSGGSAGRYGRSSRSRGSMDPKVPLPSRASRLGLSRNQPSASPSASSSSANGNVGRRPRPANGQSASSGQYQTTTSSSSSSHLSPSPHAQHSFRGSNMPGFSPTDGINAC